MDIEIKWKKKKQIQIVSNVLLGCKPVCLLCRIFFLKNKEKNRLRMQAKRCNCNLDFYFHTVLRTRRRFHVCNLVWFFFNIHSLVVVKLKWMSECNSIPTNQYLILLKHAPQRNIQRENIENCDQIKFFKKRKQKQQMHQWKIRNDMLYHNWSKIPFSFHGYWPTMEHWMIWTWIGFFFSFLLRNECQFPFLQMNFYCWFCSFGIIFNFKLFAKKKTKKKKKIVINMVMVLRSCGYCNIICIL